MADLPLKPSWERALRLLGDYTEGVASTRTFAGPSAEIERGAARALRNRGLIEQALPYRGPAWYRITLAGRSWLRRNRG